jgi:hypothetical protein
VAPAAVETPTTANRMARSELRLDTLVVLPAAAGSKLEVVTIVR